MGLYSEQKEKSRRKFNSIQRGNKERLSDHFWVSKVGRGESHEDILALAVDMSERKATVKP